MDGLTLFASFRRCHARLLGFEGSKPLAVSGFAAACGLGSVYGALWRRRSNLGRFRSTPMVDAASDLPNVKTGAYIFPIAEPSYAPTSSTGMGKEKGKQTVLIVDDEPLIRFLVRQILEDAGHEVKEASNADDALSLMAADGITVLLTDIDMPGRMDGLALARDVAARWPNIGVVITSGRRLPRPGDMPQETRFLSKPFSDQRLIDVVDDT